MKMYKHYFSKNDTPFKSDIQSNKKYHTIWSRNKYKVFLQHNVSKIKLFGIFTIYEDINIFMDRCKRKLNNKHHKEILSLSKKLYRYIKNRIRREGYFINLRYSVDIGLYLSDDDLSLISNYIHNKGLRVSLSIDYYPRYIKIINLDYYNNEV